MGTNYDWRYNYCKCCKRYDEIHIGKSSFGWTFSFQAFKHYDIESEKIPSYRLKENQPKYFEIKSYKDWLTFFDLAIGEIFDEYGKKISLDEFKDLVKDKETEKYNHTIYLLNSEKVWNRRHAVENCFLDEDGHSFSYGYFS